MNATQRDQTNARIAELQAELQREPHTYTAAECTAKEAELATLKAKLAK